MKRECLTIIGTAHVYSKNINKVKEAIYEKQTKVEEIELDMER